MSDLPAVKRPWWKSWRYLLLIFGTPIGVLGLTYGILCWRFYNSDPVISRDYVAEINAPILKIPPEHRAWTHYRRALMALEPLPFELRASRLPSDQNWSDLVRYLRRNDAALEMVRQAAKVRPMGRLLSTKTDPEDLPWMDRHGVSEPSEVIDIPLDAAFCKIEPMSIRMMLKDLLFADARRLEITKKSDEMVANLTAVIEMGMQLDSQSTMMEILIAHSFIMDAIDTINDLLVSLPSSFTPGTLAALAQALDKVLADGPLRDPTDGERFVFADFVQRVFTDDGAGNGFLRIDLYNENFWGLAQGPLFPWEQAQWNRYAAPVASLFTADRKETMDAYDAIMKAIKQQESLPLWQRNPSPVAQVIADWESVPIRYRMMLLAMSNMESLASSGEFITQRVDAARVIVAMHRYQSELKKWPDKLADLVPKYLPSVPPDRFDGQPLRYALREGQPVVYSIGTNLKDDGGTPAKEYAGVTEWTPNPSVDGDWVFWPPKKRDMSDDEATE